MSYTYGQDMCVKSLISVKNDKRALFPDQVTTNTYRTCMDHPLNFPPFIYNIFGCLIIELVLVYGLVLDAYTSEKQGKTYYHLPFLGTPSIL